MRGDKLTRREVSAIRYALHGATNWHDYFLIDNKQHEDSDAQSRRNMSRARNRLQRAELAFNRVYKGGKKHGMSGSPTYNSWASMLHRCTNEKHKSYAVYGGAGIKVCERWLNFRNFLADMGTRPTGTTLDRVGGAKIYGPGNCRWATHSHQAQNKKKRAGEHTSKYVGVSREHGHPGRVSPRRWMAKIYVNGKCVCLGYPKTEEEAARLYDAAAIKLFGPDAQTNFKYLRPRKGAVRDSKMRSRMPTTPP